MAHSGNAGLVRPNVSRLRRELGDSVDSPRYVLIEPRVGYRMRRGEMQAQVEPASWRRPGRLAAMGYPDR